LLSDTDKPHHTGLEARLAEIVAPTLADMGYELVRVALMGEPAGRGRPTVQVMADRADGTPMGIEDCENLSHALGAVLDVADPMPGAWTLEVSSPGIDRPLTRVKDWNRFAGHLARAELAEPVNGRKRLSGVILGAETGTHPPTARIRLDDGSELAVPLAAIRKAKLVLTDALIEATATQQRTN
jgi:ribosome maturation factor RimP